MGRRIASRENATTDVYNTLILTLAACETESQFPPDKENFPTPIRARMSLGVSFGPLANGVCLKYKKCQLATYQNQFLISIFKTS